MVALVKKPDLETWIDKELNAINATYRADWCKTPEARAALEGRQISLIRLQHELQKGVLDYTPNS